MLYIVTMYRYGSKEKHSYVLGVFSDKEKAIIESEVERVRRGQKYHGEIIEMELNVSKKKRIVFPTNGLLTDISISEEGLKSMRQEISSLLKTLMEESI